MAVDVLATTAKGQRWTVLCKPTKEYQMHRKMKATAAVVVAMAALLAGCGGSSHPKSVNQANSASSAVTDASVKSELYPLLNNGVTPDITASMNPDAFWQISTCAHQSGNEYVCSVWKGSDSRTISVTDDGTNIYEQGVGQGE